MRAVAQFLKFKQGHLPPQKVVGEHSRPYKPQRRHKHGVFQQNRQVEKLNPYLPKLTPLQTDVKKDRLKPFQEKEFLRKVKKRVRLHKPQKNQLQRTVGKRVKRVLQKV